MTNNKQDLNIFIKSETSSNKYSFNGSGSKRLSFIDRGKSWAKQLIKTNKIPNSPSLTAHKSFDSCDSGIDVNSYSSNSSKISTSSSCSFITNFQSEIPSTSIAGSNSSYLISPIDESGYLVPIISNPMIKKIPLRKTSNSQLIRSFSTRSAYATHHNNNPSFLSNRATICEEIRYNDSDYCIRCNSKLNITKSNSAFSFNQPIEEELVKSNQSYSFFESFTCESCLQSATAKLNVPRVRAPSPPQTKSLSNQPAPPLPSQPPPSLAKITPILISTLQRNQIGLKETKLLAPNQQTSQCSSCCCRKNIIKNSFNAKIRSSTPEFEPYIVNNSLNLSNITKAEPLIYIDSQEDSSESDMYSLLGKLKIKNSKKSPNELSHQVNHDYHHIDDSCDKQTKRLTPGDRVESFEFINLTKQEPKVVKYEPSWEDSTMIVVNNLKENLNRTMGRLSFRHKSYQLHNAQRASFPLQFNNNSDDIERLLSASLSDSDNKTMTDSSDNSTTFSNSSVDLDSASESWYQPDMPRDNVLAFLINRDIGSFVIRLSSSCKNCFALSIRVPYFANQNGVAHYLITKGKNGFKLKGVDKDFKTLKSLVTHYSVMQEILPVTLNLNDQHIDISSNFQFFNCNQLKRRTFLNDHSTKNVSCLIK